MNLYIYIYIGISNLRPLNCKYESYLNKFKITNFQSKSPTSPSYSIEIKIEGISNPKGNIEDKFKVNIYSGEGNLIAVHSESSPILENNYYSLGDIEVEKYEINSNIIYNSGIGTEHDIDLTLNADIPEGGCIKIVYPKEFILGDEIECGVRVDSIYIQPIYCAGSLHTFMLCFPASFSHSDTSDTHIYIRLTNIPHLPTVPHLSSTYIIYISLLYNQFPLFNTLAHTLTMEAYTTPPHIQFVTLRALFGLCARAVHYLHLYAPRSLAIGDQIVVEYGETISRNIGNGGSPTYVSNYGMWGTIGGNKESRMILSILESIDKSSMIRVNIYGIVNGCGNIYRPRIYIRESSGVISEQQEESEIKGNRREMSESGVDALHISSVSMSSNMCGETDNRVEISVRAPNRGLEEDPKYSSKLGVLVYLPSFSTSQHTSLPEYTEYRVISPHYIEFNITTPVFSYIDTISFVIDHLVNPPTSLYISPPTVSLIHLGEGTILGQSLGAWATLDKENLFIQCLGQVLLVNQGLDIYYDSPGLSLGGLVIEVQGGHYATEDYVIVPYIDHPHIYIHPTHIILNVIYIYIYIRKGRNRAYLVYQAKNQSLKVDMELDGKHPPVEEHGRYTRNYT